MHRTSAECAVHLGRLRPAKTHRAAAHADREDDPEPGIRSAQKLLAKQHAIRRPITHSPESCRSCLPSTKTVPAAARACYGGCHDLSYAPSHSQRGHLIASIFNGPGESVNLKAMNGSFNMKEFRNLERTLEDALKAGKQVDVKIDVIHSGDSLRPDGFVINYKVGGVPNQQIFENKVGG